MCCCWSPGRPPRVLSDHSHVLSRSAWLREVPAPSILRPEASNEASKQLEVSLVRCSRPRLDRGRSTLLRRVHACAARPHRVVRVKLEARKSHLGPLTGAMAVAETAVAVAAM